MSPDKRVYENDPSTWVAKTKVAAIKFTKNTEATDNWITVMDIRL